MEANQQTRATVLNQFRRKTRGREETQRMLTDLDVKYKVSLQRLERVNANILLYKRHEGNVLELQSTIVTTAKMTKLVKKLNKVGVKVVDLDKQNDAVDKVMGQVNEITRNQVCKHFLLLPILLSYRCCLIVAISSLFHINRVITQSMRTMSTWSVPSLLLV